MDESNTAQHEEILGPLREKHGAIASWDVPGHGLVVAAVPGNPSEYEKLVNDLNNEKRDKAIALRNFALACVVHPDRQTVKAIFTKKPAFALKVAARGQQLCGSDVEELGKD